MAADAPAAAGEGKLDFLKHKVGPLPVGVWILAGLGVWWFVSRQSSGTPAAQTDPAGNVGVINPNTGYVYGSPEDQAALAASGGGGGSTTDTTPSTSTTAGQFADNDAWGRAAVNYLVGLGVDPTLATESIQTYLASGQLTTAQQAQVNLAIQGLGAPPTLPGPSGTTNPPVVNPSPGTTYAANPPSGVTVSGKTSSTISVKWNAATNATSYVVSFGTNANASDGTVTVPAPATSATLGGLKASTLYYVRVQALPARSGDPYGSTTTTTDSSSGSGAGQPAVRIGTASRVTAVHSSWLAELRQHYTQLPPRGSKTEADYGFKLAHANGVGGDTDPRKIRSIVLPPTIGP